MMTKCVQALALVFLLVGCQSTNDPSTQDQGPAEAGPLVIEDVVTLANGKVQLGVSPALGRVVWFSLAGQDNLIWMSDSSAYDDPVMRPEGEPYYNLGGDKLWATNQMLWPDATGNSPWPPDGVFDGGAWSVLEQSEHSLTIQSEPSPMFGAVALRTFVVLPDEASVQITNALHRFEPNPIPLTLWSVTQVRPPLRALLDIAAERPGLGGAYMVLTDESSAKVDGHVEMLNDEAALVWEQAGEPHAKLGAYGRWVAAVYDDVVFHQRVAFDLHGAYPDRSSVQLYRAGEYTELETLSPLVQLAPGQELTNTVVWTLYPVPEASADAFLLERDTD